MLGDFINRGLVMILGYAYPAFECLKTLEKNRVGMDELRFWCQYWIIVALLSVAERLGDMFISWLPLYAELKLVFIIYLWYPKTKGTSYVYESFLLPFVSKHETDIERRLQELRYRAWDLAIYYMQNCTQLGQSAFFEIMHYIANQSSKLKSGVTPEKNDHNQPRGPTGPPPSPPPPPSNFVPPSPRGRPSNDNSVSSPRRHINNVAPPSPLRGAATNSQNLTRRYTPSAPPLPPTLFRSDAVTPKSKVVVMRPSEEHVEHVHVEEVVKVEEVGGVGSKPSPEKKSSPVDKQSPARFRLWRSKPDQ